MLEWTCHVCGDLRPDEFISVYSKQSAFYGVKVTQNIRYCNDRQSCIEGAPKVSFFEEDEEEDEEEENVHRSSYSFHIPTLSKGDTDF